MESAYDNYDQKRQTVFDARSGILRYATESEFNTLKSEMLAKISA